MKDYQLLFNYLKKHKGMMIISLIFAIIFVFLDVYFPVITGECVDLITSGIENKVNFNFNLLLNKLIIMLILIVLLIIFSYFFNAIVSLMTEKVCKDLKDDVFSKINETKLSYVDLSSHGDLISRMINDVDYVLVGLTGSFKQLYQGIITIILTSIFMFVLNWMLGLLVLFLTPLCFLVSYNVAKASRKYFKESSTIQGEISGISLENINNISVIKSFNLENNSFNKFKEANDRLYVSGQKAQFAASFTNPSTRLVNNSIYAIITIAGAILCVISFKDNNVLFGASCTIGVITTFLQYANKFAKPFNEMSSVIGEIEQGLASLHRINYVLSLSNDLDEGKEELTKEIKTIEFRNVDFSYVNDKKLIQNFNLKVNKGDKIAIVGPTGAGKTTMTNLLLRFYEVDGGEILINDINIDDYTKQSLYNRIGLVLQETWIFKGTILENIKYGKNDATMDEVIKATKLANAYNFIMKLPNGFDTVISDESGISAGEKQLITIARVMLMNKDIIVLDEATSNVDTRSEAKITEAFNNLLNDKTSFIIAHRLSTIINSDYIVVMNKGKVIEVGKHSDLLAKKGFYYDLFNAQFSK